MMMSWADVTMISIWYQICIMFKLQNRCNMIAFGCLVMAKECQRCE